MLRQKEIYRRHFHAARREARFAEQRIPEECHRSGRWALKLRAAQTERSEGRCAAHRNRSVHLNYSERHPMHGCSESHSAAERKAAFARHSRLRRADFPVR